jgi:hypothetical protein
VVDDQVCVLFVLGVWLGFFAFGLGRVVVRLRRLRSGTLRARVAVLALEAIDLVLKPLVLGFRLSTCRSPSSPVRTSWRATR